MKNGRSVIEKVVPMFTTSAARTGMAATSAKPNRHSRTSLVRVVMVSSLVAVFAAFS
jgi:hypothetical protein